MHQGIHTMEDLQDHPDTDFGEMTLLDTLNADTQKRPLNLLGTQFSGVATAGMTHSAEVLLGPVYRGHGQDHSSAHSISPSRGAGSTAVAINAPVSWLKTSVSAIANSSVLETMPCPKRRKLTPAEKMAKQRDVEAREEAKIAKRIQRAERAQAKEEEKRRKSEHRESNKRIKELEAQRLHDDRRQKDRSQMRLGVFFRPSNDAGHHASADIKTSSMVDTAGQKRGQGECSIRLERSQAIGPSREGEEHNFAALPVLTDYERAFLPYATPSHTCIANVKGIYRHGRTTLLENTIDVLEFTSATAAHRSPLPRLEEVDLMNKYFKASSSNCRGSEIQNFASTIIPTGSGSVDVFKECTEAGDALQSFTVRYLQFQEDVRPPYTGSYTKIRSARDRTSFARRPFSRFRTDTDYDHNSEAEYEEPDDDDMESEGLSGDDEDDSESVDNVDEMDEFVDHDEITTNNIRKPITGDLQPTSTGLCWTSCYPEAGNPSSTIGSDEVYLMETSSMSIGFLVPVSTPSNIDPFAINYWHTDMAPPTTTQFGANSHNTVGTRLPLQERDSNSLANSRSKLNVKVPSRRIIVSRGAFQDLEPAERKPTKPTIMADEVLRFKDAVVGSPLAKADLLKGLKQRFDSQDAL